MQNLLFHFIIPQGRFARCFNEPHLTAKLNNTTLGYSNALQSVRWRFNGLFLSCVSRNVAESADFIELYNIALFLRLFEVTARLQCCKILWFFKNFTTLSSQAAFQWTLTFPALRQRWIIQSSADIIPQSKSVWVIQWTPTLQRSQTVWLSRLL